MRLLDWLRGKAGMQYLEVESTMDVTVADKRVRIWVSREHLPDMLASYPGVRAEIKDRVMKMQIRPFMEWLRTCTPGVTAAQLMRIIPDDPSSIVGVVCYYRPWQ